MPEGPSLVILKEKLLPFVGKKITEAYGYAQIDYASIENKKITDIRTWGKHLFICLPKTNIKIHLRLFGSYHINEKKVKKINPKLSLQFPVGEINFYVTDVKLTPDLSAFDPAADVMSPEWNAADARKKLKSKPEMMICDVLLDQQLFSGVGNIIKSETLWRAKIHPAAIVKNIQPAAITALLKSVVSYSFEFLELKKAGKLSRNWKAYNQTTCSRCKGKITKEIWGKRSGERFIVRNAS